MEDPNEDSVNDDVGGEDMSQVSLEFIRTGPTNALWIPKLVNKCIFSGKNKQDPKGPFPATLYTHELFKMHQNRQVNKP